MLISWISSRSTPERGGLLRPAATGRCPEPRTSNGGSHVTRHYTVPHEYLC